MREQQNANRFWHRVRQAGLPRKDYDNTSMNDKAVWSSLSYRLPTQIENNDYGRIY